MSILKTTNNAFDNPWDDNQQSDNKTASNEKKNRTTRDDVKGLGFIMWNNGSKGNNKNNNGRDFGRSIQALLIIVILFPVLAFLSTGFYIVETDQEGVVTRFGRYNRLSYPGLNYKIPDPIEKVIKVSVTQINREVIGTRAEPENAFFKQKDEAERSELSVPEESRMLTGDENIIDMHFFVQWKIKDAYNYVFKIRDNPIENSTLKLSAESAMREVMGTVKLHEAISEQRQGIEKKAAVILQRILDEYQTGMEVINFGILHSYVPPEVKDAYRDIQAAKADRETSINKAYAYKNDILPRASGEAYAILEKAKGEREAVIADAQGQANKFNTIYNEYRLSKDITKKRLYIETMEEVMRDKDKILVTRNIGGATLPLLPLQNMLANKKGS